MKSATIIQFPRNGLTSSTPIDSSEIALNTRQGSKHRIARRKMMLHWPLGLAWLLVGMLWPLLKWVGAMDVLFQCLRALYFSNTPALHATLQAGVHSSCYILISLFFYLYRPKVF
ncbi:MAG: KleE stable inheritance protein [Methylosarcina sp.]